MKSMRLAKLTLTSMVLATMVVVATKPASALWPVTIVADPFNTPNWLAQAAHMVSELNNQVTQIQNEVARIKQEKTELEHISNLSMSDGRAAALASFSLRANRLGATSPSSQAAALAIDVLNGTNGSLQPTNLTSLINDIRGATGANASRDAQQEGNATVASSVQELAVLEASKIAQEQANYLEALNRRAQMMDTLGNPTDNFDY